LPLPINAINMVSLIDPLRFCLAFVPLAVYLFVIGGLNLSRRPKVVSGASDAFYLGLGLMGFVLVGPVELFLPSATAFRLGGWVWPLLVTCYLLFLTLYVLMSRPRIVIYNVGAEQLRPVLADVFASLEPEARWAGDAAFLPNLGVQMHVESVPILRNVQLIATGTAQSYEGWSRLQRELAVRLRAANGTRNVIGAGMVFCGLLLVATCLAWMMSDAELVAQSFQELIHPGE
jgi:hypothetical protein